MISFTPSLIGTFPVDNNRSLSQGDKTQRNTKAQKRYGISHGHQHTHKFKGKHFSVNINLRHLMHRHRTSTYVFGLTQAQIHQHHSHTFVHTAPRGQTSMQPENSRLKVHGDAESSQPGVQTRTKAAQTFPEAK